MRSLGFAAMLALLMLLGCSVGENPLEPKSTSHTWCTITGQVHWEQIQSPDIVVYVEALSYPEDKDYFLANQWPPDYSGQVYVAGHRFYKIWGWYQGAVVYPTSGYTRWIDDDTGTLTDIDFNVAWE